MNATTGAAAVSSSTAPSTSLESAAAMTKNAATSVAIATEQVIKRRRNGRGPIARKHRMNTRRSASHIIRTASPIGPCAQAAVGMIAKMKDQVERLNT